jgi:hypothetical protein
MPRDSFNQRVRQLRLPTAILVSGGALAAALSGILCVTVCGIIAWAEFNSFDLVKFSNSRYRLQNQPRALLWAWEYPVDLRYIDRGKTGVAFLAARILLRGDDVIVRPRVQALKIASGTYMMAVVRIETDRVNVPSLSNGQMHDLVARIDQTLAIQPVQGLQIDFDARSSERAFYRCLLKELRARLRPDMPLSVTSLASWCLGDNWISDLPCDEVVPMFFCMGRDRQRMLSCLRGKHGLGLAKIPMQESLGLSTDEPDVVAALPSFTQHVYLFSTHGWNSSRAVAWIKTIESGDKNWKRLAENL